MRSFALAACLMALQLTAHATEEDRTAARSHLAASQSRTREDVARVVEKHKGAIYALYARALRDKPGLQGKIELSFSIAPNGKVTKCTVASSTLNDAELEKRIVERFLSMDFGAKGTKTYSDPKFPLTFVDA